MGNLSGESREQIRKDKVTRFRSVTYARQLGLLVNTLGSHLNRGSRAVSGFSRNYLVPLFFQSAFHHFVIAAPLRNSK